MKSDEVFLRHILDELDFLLKRTGGINFDEFVASDVLRRACERSLEIIGEAVKTSRHTSGRSTKTSSGRRSLVSETS